MTAAVHILGPEHYDADECFDDLAPRKISRGQAVAAAREIIRQAQATRLPLELVGVEPTYEDIDSRDVMRVDTEASYKDWMTQRRQPYEDEVARRLSALEAAVADHAADNHAHGRVGRLEQALIRHASDGHGVPIEALGSAIEDATARSVQCGDDIPMSLIPATENHIRAWQDGPSICVSVRIPGPSSKPRIVSAAAPLVDEVREVAGYVVSAGIDPEAAKPTAMLLSQILGAGGLIKKIMHASPELLEQPGVKQGYPAKAKVTFRRSVRV